MEKVNSGIWSSIDKSDWVHALVVVSKNYGTVCLTTDLTSLNKFVSQYQIFQTYFCSFAEHDSLQNS